MNRIWYLSPSNQSANIGIGSYGSEQAQMYALALEIAPHLDRAGVSFIVPERDTTLNQRVRQSNEMGCCFHLALHSNAGGGGNAYGPVALYYSETGREFAQKLVNSLLALGQKANRSYHEKQQKGLYELRKTNAPAVLLEVDFHDSPVGVEFITSRRKDIAEAIAKVIIEADGKQFVPLGNNEAREEAVKLGLFPTGTDWSAPMTKGECADLALKLKDVLEGGEAV